MTTSELCKALKECLSKSVLSDLYHSGILNTNQRHNRDFSIDMMEVHKQLKIKIERVKRQSEKTIDSLQKSIDIIESTRAKVIPVE